MQPQTQPQSELESAHPAPAHFGFDPALADFPTRWVRVEQLVDVLHVTHRPDCVEQYRQAMQRGDLFPPVSVLAIGRWLFIADGHKRFQAYRLLAAKDIVIEVWPLWRWLRDQWQQFVNKTRQQWRLTIRIPFDPLARAEARRLVRETLRHWKRLAVSLFLLLSRRGRP